MTDKGQWGDTGVTPLLFTRNAMGFLMTTEDLGLTSHLKDGAFFSIVYCVPITILVSTPCWSQYNLFRQQSSFQVCRQNESPNS